MYGHFCLWSSENDQGCFWVDPDHQRQDLARMVGMREYVRLGGTPNFWDWLALGLRVVEGRFLASPQSCPEGP
jgi:hypothetical protein